MIGYFLLVSIIFRDAIWKFEPIQWPTELETYLPISAYFVTLLHWWAYKERSSMISMISATLSITFLTYLITSINFS